VNPSARSSGSARNCGATHRLGARYVRSLVVSSRGSPRIGAIWRLTPPQPARAASPPTARPSPAPVCTNRRRLRRPEGCVVRSMSILAPSPASCRETAPTRTYENRPCQSSTRPGRCPVTRVTPGRRSFLRLQLPRELVEEAPVGALLDDLVWRQLDHPDLLETKRVEADGVLGVILAPLAVRELLHQLQGEIVLWRVCLFDQ